MSRCTSCWLPVAAALWLLAVAPAHGAEGGTTREVSIPGTGLTLRAPGGVAVWPEEPARPDQASLWVEVDDLRTFTGDGVVSRADVLAQRAALAKGRAVVAEGWEEDGLSEAVALPTGGYAVVYPWYRPFEFCALEFTLNAAFFAGRRRVTLRYGVPPAVITGENPAYFSREAETNDCGAETVWKHAEEADEQVLQRFHEAAKAGRLGPAANAWYADFAAMLASLRRKTPAR